MCVCVRVRVCVVLQVWNETWVGWAEEDSNWYYALLAVTVGAYGGAITLTGMHTHRHTHTHTRACAHLWAHAQLCPVRA